jgi:predicted GNAT superfamily acetyltransferase
MTPAPRRKRRDEIKVTIGPFRNLGDYGNCVDIQREVWRFDDIDVIPIAMLLATDHCGGITLGAYNSIGEMIGFVTSILGIDGTRLLQHSHMLAVRLAYRNFDVGYKLKLAQRKESLRRKIGVVTWTFDPMQPLNAYFNLGKLGAWTAAYEENFYGESTSALHRGLPTDRFLAFWDLESPSVEKRLESGPPRHELRKELKKYTVVNRLEDAAPGMTTSSPVKLNCTDEVLLFEVPYNLPDIKNRNLGMALEWQGKMRQVFRAYFKKGYAATDFWVAEEDGHLRAFYFLEKKKR